MAIDADEGVLTAVACAAARRTEGTVARWQVTPSPHRVENMTTHSLDRVAGRRATGHRGRCS